VRSKEEFIYLFLNQREKAALTSIVAYSINYIKGLFPAYRTQENTQP
jgi:hypothetical protein